MTENVVNTKHDTVPYEDSSYKREIFNTNNLYDGFINDNKNSDWKPQGQKFEMNILNELSMLYKEVANRTFEFLPPSEFVLNERGKTRLITGDQVRDRVVKGVLCKQELLPTIKKYLIQDNGASLEGKGISFSRKQFEVHLNKYYRQRKSNDGYILLIDYVKYFDNIQHDAFVKMFKDCNISDDAMWLLEKTVRRSRVDVSYMDDAEYQNCMNEVFNSLKYQKIDKKLLSGDKFMNKHFNIGCTVAQVAGIAYPTPIDNYIKIVKGVKFYGRYMDDSYIIHESKEYLEELLVEIAEVAKSIGIELHPNKTRICKLSSYFRYLQIQYALTDTGRIIKKINPKRLTDMRRKLKKLALILTEVDFDKYYRSWFKNHYKIMSKQQRENMDTLFDELKEANYGIS